MRPWAEPQQIWRVPWSLHPPRFLLCLQMLCASWPWARNPLHRRRGSCAEGQPGQGSGVTGSPTGWGIKKKPLGEIPARGMAVLRGQREDPCGGPDDPRAEEEHGPRPSESQLGLLRQGSGSGGSWRAAGLGALQGAAVSPAQEEAPPRGSGSLRPSIDLLLPWLHQAVGRVRGGSRQPGAPLLGPARPQLWEPLRGPGASHISQRPGLLFVGWGAGRCVVWGGHLLSGATGCPDAPVFVA